MADQTAIEWTDATWTPIRARNLKTGKVGWHCEHATTGCEFCYAEGMNLRLGTGLPFKPGHRKDIEIFLDEEMLLAPLKWKKPRMIFVCSMTDLFADFVKDEWIEKIFEVMLQTNHRYQVLTKRAARMQGWITQFLAPALLPTILENIWLGISAERQEEFDERYPFLRDTPAVVRFISFEPLIGHIEPQLHGIHWAIVGGESGSRARPMQPKWARRIRNVCAENGVAFFFKQWGEWAPRWPGNRSDGIELERVGKKAAGRLLDGREHSAFPVTDVSVSPTALASHEPKKQEASA